MRFFIAITLACSFASSAYAFCSSEAGSKEQLQAVQQQIAALAANRSEIARGPKKDATFNVGVVWNYFYDQNNSVDGFIP